METTPLSTALTTFLSDPANAKAMMKTLVAAACNSSADNAGATALGGNYVHLLVDKSTGDIKFRSEADDAAVASGQDIWKAWTPANSGDTLEIQFKRDCGIVFIMIDYYCAGVIYKGFRTNNQVNISGNYAGTFSVSCEIKKLILTSVEPRTVYYLQFAP